MLFRRLQSPPRQRSYQDYKEYLRKDFLTRCAYCLIHEAHFGGLRNFHVDHFRPKKRFPRLALSYVNLYYACGLCNTFKGQTWPTRTQLKRGFAFGDPCKENVYDKHLRVDETDGSLHPLTNIGRYMNLHLRLDRRQMRRYRSMQIDAKRRCQELRAALLNPKLPPLWVAKVKELLDHIERQTLNPPAPYEVSDLAAGI